MIKKFFSIVLAGALTAAGLAACGQPDASAPAGTAASAAAGETSAVDQTATGGAGASGGVFSLGGLAPLTGSLSVYGTSTNNGIEMAVEEINTAGGIAGQSIEYHVLDEKGDVTEATNAYARLVSDYSIDALIGDVTSKPSISVAQRAGDDGMPMVTPTGTADPITAQGQTVFRTCFTDAYQGRAMAAYVNSKGLKSVAVLYDNSDDYSVALYKAFVAEAKNSGITVTAEESFGATDSDFKAQLTKIVSTNPEVLYVPAYYETNALILRQAKETGFKGQVIGGDGWDGILSQFKNDPTGADGVIFSNHYSLYDADEKVQKFVNAYKSKYNEDPTAFSALGYDSVYLIKQAVEAAGTKDKAAVVRALEGIQFAGVTGSFTFDDQHNPVKTVSFIQIKDGKYELDGKQAADAK